MTSADLSPSLCSECGHPEFVHAKNGPCMHSECDCPRFVSEAKPHEFDLSRISITMAKATNAEATAPAIHSARLTASPRSPRPTA